MMKRKTWLLSSSSVLVCLSIGCSSNEAAGGGSVVGGATHGAGSNAGGSAIAGAASSSSGMSALGAGGSGGGGSPIIILGGGTSAGASGSTGSSSNGMEELCDGIDNDANGIADDRDIGQDGICDCLQIATLGLPGEWGDGDVFDTWLDSRSDAGAVDLNDKLLTPELLAPFQVIVVQDVSRIGRAYAPEEVRAFVGWLSAGGGAMTLIGYGSAPERSNVNALLADTGVSYGSEQILKKAGGNTIPVKSWQPHPVTLGVQQLGVDNGYPVEGAAPVLASESGFDMLKATEHAKGRVLVWGDEWITYNSEWSGHPEYQVELFWVNAIKWLTPVTECQVPVPPSIPR